MAGDLIHPMRTLRRLSRIVTRGAYPHEFSWLIDNPIRRLFITPETITRRLDPLPTAWILEIGPGSGYFSVDLAAAVPQGRLVLCDLQPEMLAKARTKLQSHNVGYAACRATMLPFGPSLFDYVVLITVLGEVRPPEGCIAAAAEVLRPGGKLAVHEHLPDPDFTPFPNLSRMCAAVGVRFTRRWGPSWNYTAVFTKAE